EASVIRILDMKWKLGLVKHAITNPNRVGTQVGTQAHLAVAQRAAERSITLVKNNAKLLPLAPNSGKKVLVTGANTTTIGNDIRARHLTTQVVSTGLSPDPAKIAEAVAAAQSNDLVVVATFNAWSFPKSLALVNALIATGKPVIWMGVG